MSKIKKRDFKIKALELELATLANNSDETTKKLQNELNEKEKLLKQRERDIKKSAFEKYSLNNTALIVPSFLGLYNLGYCDINFSLTS